MFLNEIHPRRGLAEVLLLTLEHLHIGAVLIGRLASRRFLVTLRKRDHVYLIKLLIYYKTTVIIIK